MIFYSIQTFILHDIPQGIVNLYVYFPVIWRTREWDYAYLYELMEFKLKRMEKTLRHGVAADRKKVADQIWVVHRSLNRLIKDDYMLLWSPQRATKEQQNDLKVLVKGMKQSLGWWD